MQEIQKALQEVRATLEEGVSLLAVSKTHPAEYIQEAYEAGQRDFAENKVQELQAKVEVLPKDIRWHFIGHLQTNKVKYIVPYIHLIHTVDSMRLLQAISKEVVKFNAANKADRVVDVLLEVHIAQEETKTGLGVEELDGLLKEWGQAPLEGVRIRGLMAMASNTDDMEQVEREFEVMNQLKQRIGAQYFAGDDNFDQLSMGMSGDYELAQKHGSTMVRVGSKIFGARYYMK
ncbi:MAG: YggS family pyridoxal phosphate-dependent enzyme [Bacteroidales bacterium]|nr:YggS family pyridoxal phosphate-dependent enzyme [Bacteroidales bacterium]